jgi:hypothetical protein
MSPKPHEHVIRGDPDLLQWIAEDENPEFIIEDATESAPTPPADSPEAKLFIRAAENALEEMNNGHGTNGSEGSIPSDAGA